MADDETKPVSNSRRRKWLRRMIWFLVGFIGLWLIGDFAYSRYVASEINRWESTIQRNENGVQVGCEEFKLENGPVAILFVHGFNDSPQIWRKIAPEVANQNFTCHAIRLPGFGEPIENYAASTTESWLSKLDSEIKLLQKDHSMIVVVAHSLGGAVTINHLLNHPGCVDGVVLLAPAIEVSNARSPVFSAEFWHRFSSYTLPFSRIAKSPFDYDARDPAERDFAGRNVFSPRRVVDNTYQLIHSNRGRAGEIKIPIRVFVSPSDAVVDAEATKRFFEQLGAENKKLLVADKAGHSIPVDYGWETVVDETVAFANELAAGGSNSGSKQ